MGIFYIYVFGLTVLLGLEGVTKQKYPLLIMLPLGFLVGCVIVVIELLLVSTFGGRWNWVLLLICNLAFSAWVIGWQKSRLKEIVGVLKRLPKIVKVQDLVLLGLLVFVYLFYRKAQLQHDFLHSDGLSYWFMKGRMFFIDNFISHETLSNPAFITRVVEPFAYEAFDQSSLRPTYPVFVPLLIAWQFMVKGAVDILSAKFLWLHLTLGTIVYLYWLSGNVLKSFAWGGLVGPLLFTGLPYFWFTFSIHSFGSVDPWISTYLLVGVSLLYFWLKNVEKRHYLLVSGMLIGATTFVKVEGIFALSVLPVLLLGDYKFGSKFKLSFLKLISVFLSTWLAVVWFWHTTQLTITTTYSAAFRRNLVNWQDFIGNIVEVLPDMLYELGKVSSHGVLWYVWVILMALYVYLSFKRRIWDTLLWLHIVLAGWFGLMATLFTFAPERFENFISTAFSRYAFQVEPVLLFFVLLLSKKIAQLWFK